MGGRGTYSEGKPTAFTYVSIGEIEGVKILKPINNKSALKLPEESHTANNKYVLLDKNGIFHQYREYDENHKVIFEIGYHVEPSLGSGKTLHVHIHNTPGVEYHSSAKKFAINPGNPIYEKYKSLFVGVN